jgi:hypothetical protein
LRNLPFITLPLFQDVMNIESMHEKVVMGRMGVKTTVLLGTTIAQWVTMVGTSMMTASSVLRMIISSIIGIAYSRLDPSILTFRSSMAIIQPTGLTRQTNSLSIIRPLFINVSEWPSSTWKGRHSFGYKTQKNLASFPLGMPFSRRCSPDLGQFMMI